MCFSKANKQLIFAVNARGEACWSSVQREVQRKTRETGARERYGFSIILSYCSSLMYQSVDFSFSRLVARSEAQGAKYSLLRERKAAIEEVGCSCIFTITFFSINEKQGCLI